MRSSHLALAAIVLCLCGILAAFFLIGNQASDSSPRAALGPGAQKPNLPVASSIGDSEAPTQVEQRKRNRAALEGSGAQQPRLDLDGTHEAQVALPPLRTGGRVTTLGGRPLAGARLKLSCTQQTLRTVSDSEGRFEWRVPLSHRSWTLRVELEGFVTQTKADLRFEQGRTLEQNDIRLAPAARLRGCVVDSAGRAVSAAELVLDGGLQGQHFTALTTGFESQRTTAGSDGCFDWNQVPPGRVALRVEAPGFAPGHWLGRAPAAGDEPVSIRIELKKGVQTRGKLPPTPFLDFEQVEVILAWDRDLMGGPFANPIIARRSPCNAEGEFTFDDLPSEKRVWVRARRAECAPSIWLSDARALSTAEPNWSFPLYPPASVSLQVIDAVDQNPIQPDSLRIELGGPSGERIEATLHGAEWEWNARQGISIPRLPFVQGATGAVLYLEKQGFGLARLEFTGRAVAGTSENLGTLSMHPLWNLMVSVRASDSNLPVAGARVYLDPLPGDDRRLSVGSHSASAETRVTTTDGDGTALHIAPTQVPLQLWVEHPDFATSDFRSVVVKGENPLLNVESFQLQRGASLRVQIKHTDGSAATWQISGRPAARDLRLGPRPSITRISNEMGVIEFEHLQAGEFQLAPFSENATTQAELMALNPTMGPDGWLRTNLGERVEQQLEIIVPFQVSFGGRVLEAGKPLQGAKLKLFEDSDEALEAENSFLPTEAPNCVSDSSGQFRMQGVTPGRYTLAVSHSGRALPSHFDFEIGDVDLETELSLERLSVFGHVRDADGHAVAGAYVRIERVGQESRNHGLREIIGTEPIRTSVLGPDQFKTDLDGRFELLGVTPLINLVLNVDGPWVQSTRSAAFQLAPGAAPLRIDIPVEAAGKLEVQLDSSGPIPSGLQLSATQLGKAAQERAISAPARADGHLELTGLAPGIWRVELTRMFGTGFLPEPVQVEIEASRVSNLRFALP